MILQVFANVGDTLSVAVAYNALANLNPSDPYRWQKAAGSLGGSSKSGLLEFDSAKRTWKRVR